MQVKNLDIRERIIEVSRQCFFEKGYKGASLSEIARKSYTTMGNIYTYFENKQAIFDEVIGNVPFEIDAYIAKHYKTIVEKMNTGDGNIDWKTLFPDNSILTKKIGMTLSIMLYGSKNTKYEYYRQGLLNILKDYTRQFLGEKADSGLIDGISNTFIERILSVAESANAEKGKRTENELFEIEVDMIHCVVFVEIRKWLKGSEWESYWRTYEKATEGIDKKVYMFKLDSRQMPDVAENKYMFDAMKKYYDEGYKSFEIIFSPKQIALMIQLIRIMNEIGYEEVKTQVL